MYRALPHLRNSTDESANRLGGNDIVQTDTKNHRNFQSLIHHPILASKKVYWIAYLYDHQFERVIYSFDLLQRMSEEELHLLDYEDGQANVRA